MRSRIILPVIGLGLVLACSQGRSIPDGASLIDEELALKRGPQSDSAIREFTVDGDSVIAAIVDERLTDVRVQLSLIKPTAHAPVVEVENHLGGAGVEVATLRAPSGARVRVSVLGAADATKPGVVHLRVRSFDAGNPLSNYNDQVAALASWSAATPVAARADRVRKTGLEAMNRAVERLASPQGDARLAAQARLVKARMLSYFRIDSKHSRDEARRAAAAFAVLETPDARGVARAQYLEALALVGVAGNGAAENPSPAEATRLARELLAGLTTEGAALTAVERARAIALLGDIELDAGNADFARRHYEDAAAIYRAAGNSTGELLARFSLAVELLSRGAWRDSAQAFDPLLPQLHRIANPDVRAAMLIHAARAQAFCGRGDEAPENLHQALAIAREHRLRVREAAALHGLGNVNQSRGDPLQAREFYAEAIKITREENDIVNLVGALELAGFVARTDGDFDTAFAMHREAVRLASNPVAQARSLRALALDYYHAGDAPQAIVEFRRALAVKLQDPRHHAYSDIKRDLAEALVIHGDGSSATLAEADELSAAALSRSREVDDKQGIIGAHRVRGQLHVARGEFRAAQLQFEESLSFAHEYRERMASSEARAAPLRQEQAALRGYIDLMLREVADRSAGVARFATERELRALRLLENSRESNFGIARTGPLDAKTAAQVDSLLVRMGNLSLAISEMVTRAPTPAEAADLRDKRLEMSNLYSEIDRVRTAAAVKRARAENFRPNAEREWRALKPGEVQLSYALGNEHVYAWVRSADGVSVLALNRSPQDLERELIELGALNRQSAPQQVERALERVSATLLPKGLLPANSNIVGIVAEGRIAGVPFAGLRSPTRRGSLLVETHAITMLTSMFEVQRLPRPAHARPMRLVALASGNGTLRSVPVADPASKLNAASKEIRAVAELFVARDPAAKVKLLTGAEGSANALRDLWVSGADVVHFATHALADLRQPLASLLVLPATNARGAPTYLTAGQVENWRGDAELVFLSACESAIGPPRFASGMPGIQRAFLRAGARGVIATLWPIEDVLAEEFSADFYRRFTRGEPAERALGATQRAWLTHQPDAPADMQIRRRITALAHAYYAN
jgi:CHAT domain-containing protein/tetratricopeptide (TPR) repeat protein